MEATQFFKALRSHYLKRDPLTIVKLVNAFRGSAQFAPFYRQLIKKNPAGPTQIRLEEIIQAILQEIEDELESKQQLIIKATFYDIAEHLGAKYDKQLSDIYIETQIPSEFIANIRCSYDTGDNHKLTETLVTNYKKELIRLEQGREAVIAALQQSSNFPLRNARRLADLLEGVHQRLRSNYKYLSVKPYLLAIRGIGRQIDGVTGDTEEAAGEERLLYFRHYALTGEEPGIGLQANLQISVNRLLQFLKNNQLLTPKETERYWQEIGDILTYRGDARLSPKEWKILTDLLTQINQDKQAITRKLAATFVDEYRCAEEQMRLRQIIIQNELADTEEYLNQITRSDELASRVDPEKIKVAIDKLLCLQDTFPITAGQRESAARKSHMDVERTALGVSTVITPSQLADWIRIYSIIFSNSEYLELLQMTADFSNMRRLISNLTSFHLYDNIAQLKNIVERNLPAAEEKREPQFKRFNNALKQRLLGLMGSSPEQQKEELSLREMIEELGFLQNKSVQFIIAETFKGFQHIVDAFNQSRSDYFVRDKDAMLLESRALYNQICNQSLQILDRKSAANPFADRASPATGKRRSWLARLFA